MAVTFGEIFPEYFTLYRGQATNIPGENDPEYKIAIQLAQNGVRKWDRADGLEWKVLWKTLSDNDTPTLIEADKLVYPITDMRKPPKKITVGGSTIRVVNPQEVDLISGSNFAWFTGSATLGFKLHLKTVDTLVGKEIDFIYLKTPNKVVDANSIIEMSDPNYLIQEMLASRFTNARNGFAVKVHKGEATLALQNMKIEDISGTYGNSDNLGSYGSGWGVTRNASII